MKMARHELVLERGEYLSRTKEFALRGQDLPQSKLTDDDVMEIRSMIKQRENMKVYIRQNLSNQAIADKFNIHIRNVEKISTYQTWAHLI